MGSGEVTERAILTSASLDWDALRKRSLEPHGFRDERKTLWPQLLHVDSRTAKSSIPTADTPSESSATTDAPDSTKLDLSADLDAALAHRDERQIGLDTNRSFVLYPVDEGPDREHLKEQLHELIVSVFRKRRHLNYFQGFHDIVSVLFLTLPSEAQASSVEKMSLHRIRDAMGMTLEPVLGLLRILKRLLHELDPDFSSVLERTSPLPYFALSNILTLLSHDVPTLPLIQHIFDYLLCRHPSAVVYLVAAVVLSRRDEVRQLVEAGDEGMVHSVLSTLPELYEEYDDAIPDEGTCAEAEHEPMAASTADTPDAAIVVESSAESLDNIVEERPADFSDDMTAVTSLSAMSDTSSTAGDDESTTVGLESEAEDDIHEKADTSSTSLLSSDEPESASTEPASNPDEGDLSEKRPLSRASTVTQSDDAAPPRPRVSLTSLLMQADDLYARFPPSHPSIALATIMGPQSVMLTWSEDTSELPPDDDAELMVTKPELIVVPWIEPDDEVESDEEGASPRGKRRSRAKDRERRRLKKPRHLVLQRKTMVAGAVLVLGVAVAVYGLQSGGSAGLFRGFSEHRERHTLGREWKRMSSFVGGVVLGVGERIFEPLLHGG
ncbi:rab-GTPase-TBC domain-containing protein [Fomitopsis serialis]|uniref:rab-GTPase-TBC domain-containing protein n=1 Tax=Fomitopsis serialis TaxID=139415 RepID=UPI00200796EA|nr:rab-GTPase-TBC domain-containing protein [Neoantrodia serialis]KAH9916046.1 rab-GTPase-TBC domain-containing protein [Neoantrodia serialis]